MNKLDPEIKQNKNNNKKEKQIGRSVKKLFSTKYLALLIKSPMHAKKSKKILHIKENLVWAKYSSNTQKIFK